MVEQSKINKTNQVRAIYDKVAEFYNAEYENTSALIDIFLRLVKKNGKILDVGCRTGKDASYMSDKGFEVLGIGVSKKNDWARKEQRTEGKI
ncbi:MAG: methyltransferase domain-containing protein [Patescibacteria group bacterium]